MNRSDVSKFVTPLLHGDDADSRDPQVQPVWNITMFITCILLKAFVQDSFFNSLQSFRTLTSPQFVSEHVSDAVRLRTVVNSDSAFDCRKSATKKTKITLLYNKIELLIKIDTIVLGNFFPRYFIADVC